MVNSNSKSDIDGTLLCGELISIKAFISGKVKGKATPIIVLNFIKQHSSQDLYPDVSIFMRILLTIPLRRCWSGLFYRHFTDEMGDFLDSTFRRQYATYMPQILQDCRVDINAWSSSRISTENVQKMKIIVFY